MSPSAYSRVASGLFAAEAVFPIAHRFAGADYRGLTPTFSMVVDSGLAIVWITAAVAGLTRRSGVALAVMCIGAMLSLTHGLLFSVANSSLGPYGVGLPFLLAGIAQTYLIVRAAPAFRHAPEEPREPSPAPSPAHQARSMA